MLAVLVCLLQGQAIAQESPVEIPLVPPPPELYVIQPAGPEWRAPSLPCGLCQEDKSAGLCGCHRPLTQELAEELYELVDGLVRRAFDGKVKLLHAVRVRVSAPDSLRQLAGRSVQGLYEEGVIYLSSDLRRREAVAVLAHEYGHAWQYQHRQDIDRVEALLFEGFAEWVSYRVLTLAGDYRGTDAVLRDPSDYGRGARWYLAQEKKAGLDSALECARYRMRR